MLLRARNGDAGRTVGGGSVLLENVSIVEPHHFGEYGGPALVRLRR